MSDFVIRPAEAADLGQFLELLKALNPGDPDLTRDEAEPVWRRLLASDQTVVLVAAREGLLLSTCTLTVTPNLTRGARPYALVENVVTRADHRKQGYGKAVLRAAIERAWGEGAYKVMLATGSKRPATLAFYESVGFARNPRTFFEIRRQ